MAAHDDKISTNRRKLFKALSAAPVVATLQPGSALANASAFYCAAKIRTLTIADWIPESSVTGSCATTAVGIECTVDGVIYRKLNYWAKSDVDGSSLSEVCRLVYNALPGIVVGLNGGYYDLTGAPVANVSEDGVDPSGRSLLKVSGTSGECFVLSAYHGLFSYVGHTVNQDTGWEEDGFFPQYKISGLDAPSELQGMTESCMDSFTTATVSRLSGG